MTAIERLREWLDSEPEDPGEFPIPNAVVQDARSYAAWLLLGHHLVQRQITKPTIPGVEKGRLEFRLRTIEEDARELLEAMP